VERGSFILEKPREWSPLTLADTGGISNFDVDPDGTRVLALLPATVEDRQSVDHVTMILNSPTKYGGGLHRRRTDESRAMRRTTRQPRILVARAEQYTPPDSCSRRRRIRSITERFRGLRELGHVRRFQTLTSIRATVI